MDSRKALLKKFVRRHHGGKKPHHFMGGRPKANPKAPFGQGGRFAALEDKLSHRKGVTDPAALAASIGRAKYGKKRFQGLSK